jgi:hypothetical protein
MSWGFPDKPFGPVAQPLLNTLRDLSRECLEEWQTFLFSLFSSGTGGFATKQRIPTAARQPSLLLGDIGPCDLARRERDPMLDHYQDSQDFIQALTRAEAGIYSRGLNDGLGDLRILWERHVGDTEDRVFRTLVAEGPAADGLVGFFLAEHADLSTRLTALTNTSPSAERSQATIRLIHRLIQHVYLEARVLSPSGRSGAKAGADTHVGAP